MTDYRAFDGVLEPLACIDEGIRKRSLEQFLIILSILVCISRFYSSSTHSNRKIESDNEPFWPIQTELDSYDYSVEALQNDSTGF